MKHGRLHSLLQFINAYHNYCINFFVKEMVYKCKIQCYACVVVPLFHVIVLT